VTMGAAALSAFTNGVVLPVPPFTIQSIEWQIATNPQNPRITINGGALTTLSESVALELAADSPEPSQMQVSEDAAFAGAVWTNYRTAMPFTLSADEGVKTVHARFRTAGGALSETAGTSIVLVPEPVLLPGSLLLALIIVRRCCPGCSHGGQQDTCAFCYHRV